MTARVRVSDPNRNYVLFDTQYPTLCLSNVNYIGAKEGDTISTVGGKGCLYPMVVMPIYPVDSKICLYIDHQFQQPRNNQYDDISTQINSFTMVQPKASIPIFTFDVPDLAMTPSQRAGLKVYNHETGKIMFDSRTLPLNVIGLCRDNVVLDPNRKYGYVDLSGGLYAEETQTLSHYSQDGQPYSTVGYFNHNGKIVSAQISDKKLQQGGYYALKPKKSDMPKLTNPYHKFRAWYWPHLLVDLTHIYNAMGIKYEAPYQ